MTIEVVNTPIPEVKIIIPQIFGDDRGFFMESWNQQEFEDKVCKGVNFVQDNHSRSKKGVVRGLHYQINPHPQAKLVRCLQGTIFDVAVDIRKNSPTYSNWVGVELSAENKKQLWIPEGFAHGFIVVSEFAEVFYKTSEFWHKECEANIIWNDPEIGITWPEVDTPILSDKDVKAPCLRNARPFDWR